jgi:hypothetical protein
MSPKIWLFSFEIKGIYNKKNILRSKFCPKIAKK